MGGNPEKALAAIAAAVKQAELAYEFTPGSYTHSAMVTLRAAEKVLAEYLELVRDE